MITDNVRGIVGDSVHTMVEGTAPVGEQYSGGRLVNFTLEKLIIIHVTDPRKDTTNMRSRN